MHLFYGLDPETKDIFPIKDYKDIQKFSEFENRKICRDEIGRYSISTVFLMINHARKGKGPPILFETVVFEGHPNKILFLQSYASWREAVEGHERAVEIFKEKLEKPS